MIRPRFFEILVRGRLRARPVYQSHKTHDDLKRGAYPIDDGEMIADFDGASKWGADFIQAFGTLVVTRKIIDQIAQSDLTGIKWFPVRIRDVDNAKLAKQPRPELFWLKFCGWVEVEEGRIYKPEAKTSLAPMVHQTIPRPETWDRSDFFRIRHQQWLYLLCSRKVVEVGRRFNWKDVSFIPMDLPKKMQFDYGQVAVHLDKQWPPKWYPEGYEPDPANLEKISGEYPDPRHT